jgi:hypothetical protein
LMDAQGPRQLKNEGSSILHGVSNYNSVG